MKASQAPPYTVHFFGSLTHVQRATATRLLRDSGLRWKGGITDVPNAIGGLDEDNLWKQPTREEREAIWSNLATDRLLAPALNRAKYQFAMRDCKVVLSITGYGEICYRMAEAWGNRRVLVCQDLSHVETLFPLKPNYNVVYCKPDLSDLIDVLDDIECNFSHYMSIAEQGYEDWRKWSENPDKVVRLGFWPLYSASRISTKRPVTSVAIEQGSGQCIAAQPIASCEGSMAANRTSQASSTNNH
jgi:hypothetical protein